MTRLGRSLRDDARERSLIAQRRHRINARRAQRREIACGERDATIVVPVADLDWIEADTYYVRLHTAEGRPRLVRERMAVLEARLDPAHFVRTHRSAIVRLDRIRAIHTVSRYEHVVLLTNGARVPLSRERRARLESLLRDEPRDEP